MSQKTFLLFWLEVYSITIISLIFYQLINSTLGDKVADTIEDTAEDVTFAEGLRIIYRC